MQVSTGVLLVCFTLFSKVLIQGFRWFYWFGLFGCLSEILQDFVLIVLLLTHHGFDLFFDE